MDFLKNIKYLDWTLLVAVLALAVIGIFFVYSASYQISRSTGIDFARRQAVWMAVGLVIFVLLALVDYRKLLSMAYFLFILTTVFLLILMVLGVIRSGARRWIQLGAFSIQPSEFAKVTLVLVMARYLAYRLPRRGRWSYLLVPGLLAAGPALLILKQPDLGTALVFFPVTIGMALIAGARVKHVVIILVILALISPGFWFFLKEYQRDRITVFINPDIDPLGSGYTIIQSKIAIGSGKIWGKGWLGGTQNMLSFLPERQTDFIFSVVAEEWGFMGSLAIMGIYALIVFRLYQIALGARDLGGRLLVVGALFLFSSHVLINVGMAMGLLPATGLPLPLLSYGGSVTTTTLALLGICQSVHTHRYWY